MKDHYITGELWDTEEHQFIHVNGAEENFMHHMESHLMTFMNTAKIVGILYKLKGLYYDKAGLYVL